MPRVRTATVAGIHERLGDATLALSPEREDATGRYLVRQGLGHLLACGRVDEAERRMLDPMFMGELLRAHADILAPLGYWRAIGRERATVGYTRLASELGPGFRYQVRALRRIARFLVDAGMYRPAMALLERTRELLESTVAPDHWELLAILGQLARVRHIERDFDGAQALYERLAIAATSIEDSLGWTDAQAVLCWDRGDLAGAERLQRSTLESLERVSGRDSEKTLSSTANLAALLTERGALEQAEPLHLRAVEGLERTLGADDPYTLSAKNNFAAQLRAKGDTARAEGLYRGTLEKRERLLGPEHPDTLASLLNLANLLRDTKRGAAAEPMYERAIAGFERTLGPEDPAVLLCLQNLGRLLLKSGRLIRFASVARRAFALGDAHWKRASQDLFKTDEAPSISGIFAVARRMAELQGLTARLNARAPRFGEGSFDSSKGHPQPQA